MQVKLSYKFTINLTDKERQAIQTAAEIIKEIADVTVEDDFGTFLNDYYCGNIHEFLDHLVNHPEYVENHIGSFLTDIN
jgi:hypothetical protein